MTMIAEKPKTRKGSYDPGSPKGIERVNRDEFIVESFNSPDWYDVNLRTQSCNCPDHQIRHRRCKHILFAEMIAFEAALRSAKQMTQDELMSAIHSSRVREIERRAAREVLSYRFL